MKTLLTKLAALLGGKKNEIAFTSGKGPYDGINAEAYYEECCRMANRKGA